MICDAPESLEQDESAELASTTVAASKRTRGQQIEVIGLAFMY